MGNLHFHRNSMFAILLPSLVVPKWRDCSYTCTNTCCREIVHDNGCDSILMLFYRAHQTCKSIVQLYMRRSNPLPWRCKLQVGTLRCVFSTFHNISILRNRTAPIQHLRRTRPMRPMHSHIEHCNDRFDLRSNQSTRPCSFVTKDRSQL